MAAALRWISAGGREATIERPGDGSLTQALKLAKLDCNAFFNTEFW